jgi:predicted membrane-bound mannosyltransferase
LLDCLHDILSANTQHQLVSLPQYEYNPTGYGPFLYQQARVYCCLL